MFRAYDADRERLVAVKLFKLDLPPERVHQLVTALEALIVAELSHPVLVAPVAAGISEVSAYFGQEFVAAESLDAAIREYGPAPGTDAVRVAAQLAGALDFAAVVNVAHGSLHPRDVLISADTTRLTGIGIARALELVGVTAPVRRPYSAPERASGAAWDRRADIFSLAALIHELMWGRRIAGTGSHAADALTEVEGGELPKLRDVFARALADDPADRFETALDFADALKRAFPGVTIASQAASVAPSPVPDRRRVVERAVQKEEREERDEPRLPLEAPAVAAPISIRGSRTVPEATESLDLNFPSERFRDVEAAPEIPVPEVRVHEEPPHVDEPEVTVAEPPPISMIEQSRSAVWPLMAALVIGLAIGFAGGYGVGSRDRSASAAAGVTGRDATDVAIADPTTRPQPDAPALSSPPRADGPATQARVPAVQPAPGTSTPATTKTAAKTAPPAATESQRAPADRLADARTARPQSQRESAPAAKPGRGAPSIRTPERTSANRTAPTRTPPRPADRPSSADASGTAGGFVGVLMVESRPTGASVFLDGKLIGTTPLAAPSVAAGEHAVRLELAGYRRWSASVRVVAAERNRVTASLER